MGDQQSEDPGPRRAPLTSARDYMMQLGQARADRIVVEIQANRRGEYKVPTWVLVIALAAMIGGIVAMMVFA